MSIKFVLTLVIEGSSLDEIDDQLAQAAGQRLIARMTNPPKINGSPLMPKGGPRVTVEERQEKAKKGKGVPKPPESAPVPPQGEASAPKPKPSHDEPHVKALRAVYDRFGEEGARDCLMKFGIQKLGELPSDQSTNFVQYANLKLEAKNEN